MRSLTRREPLILFAGDLLFFCISLWLSLLLRYGEELSRARFFEHLAAFAPVFALWVVVFFIAGLYEKHTTVLRRKLPDVTVRTQLANSVIAVLFFYFVPHLPIAPKVNLFLYLLVSFALLILWRAVLYPRVAPAHRENAITIGSGAELTELLMEVNNNPGYDITFVSAIDVAKLEGLDFKEAIVGKAEREGVTLIAVDLKDPRVEPILPYLYGLIFSSVRVVEMHRMYEAVFNRIPLSLVGYRWFLEHVSARPRRAYDALKRGMDVILSFCLGLISLVLYPFVFLAVALDDGGPFFIVQKRVGRGGAIIKTRKFRTMSVSSGGGSEHITAVGGFLRKSRIDELPQLWNVLAGDLSLIGPRPELPELVRLYEKEIPYYNVRHLLKPGLSGWAQIYHEGHPHYAPNVSQTRVKLSYDLYYIKNRSFFLDLKIALRTIQTLLSRSGI